MINNQLRLYNTKGEEKISIDALQIMIQIIYKMYCYALFNAFHTAKFMLSEADKETYAHHTLTHFVEIFLNR